MKFAVILFSTIVLLGCSNPGLPTFHNQTLPCSKSNLPILEQPERDIVTGNGLVACYCVSSSISQGTSLELSFVFQDEVHPSVWKDKFYRIYRRIVYGRTYDIESFHLIFGNDRKLRLADLKDVYSKGQFYLEDPVEHYDSVLNSQEIEIRNGRPVFYINTWNHLFSEKDANPNLAKREWVEYELRKGSRENLDNYFQ
ncbi:hypothetical protein CH373_09430 [Leptospira perolatii]|uniref:Lipoprotein n=1 Tax=Leptospira perolatii TaxID=2023191 RepID=A0A2M9ZM90_9LEPT|nr:hypothetical protein [Leptospira perolatii]PJZ68505.1 hypothetical protein CH360_15930 [Leptospira perolatii]PJZ73202.1 hypothetical protein CH373_09430 [Leptospira perolatii]